MALNFFFLFSSLATIALYISLAAGDCRYELDKKVFDYLFHDDDYRYHLRPPPPSGSGTATDVTVQISVNNVIFVDPTQQMWSLDAFYRLTWVDSRLAYNNHIDGLGDCSAFQYLQLVNGAGFCSYPIIWRPDISISNGISSYFHDTLEANRFLRIYPNGTVWTSVEVTMTDKCDGKYKGVDETGRYTCTLNLNPYGSQTFDIRLLWHQYPIFGTVNEDYLGGLGFDTWLTDNPIVISGSGSYYNLNAYLRLLVA